MTSTTTPPPTQVSAESMDLAPTLEQTTYIHNFTNIMWHMDEGPIPDHPAQLFHLLTITGLLIVGTYPEEHTLGEHYLAWAPLSSEVRLTIH